MIFGILVFDFWDSGFLFLGFWFFIFGILVFYFLVSGFLFFGFWFLIFGRNTRFFVSPNRLDRLWIPPSRVFSWFGPYYLGNISDVSRARNSGVNTSASAYAFVACIGTALLLLCHFVRENCITNTRRTQCKNTENGQNTT